MTHQIYAYRFRRLDRELRKGPVGPFVDDFASLLLDQGYPRKYLRTRFLVIKALNRWLIRKKIDMSKLDGRRIDQFIRYRSTQKEMCGRGEIVTLNSFISMMRNRGVVPAEEVESKPMNKIEKVPRASSR